MMEVLVNDKKVSVSENCSLKELLADLDITSDPGIAVALNDQVVTRKQWKKTILNPSDKVLLIKATQGG